MDRARTGVLCVEDHEHIRAVMCVLTGGRRVVLARCSVPASRTRIRRYDPEPSTGERLSVAEWYRSQ
jgi:hypothetical protein